MTPEPARREYIDVLQRVQGEFLEMPGLRLSEPQARRLWGLDAEQCSGAARRSGRCQVFVEDARRGFHEGRPRPCACVRAREFPPPDAATRVSSSEERPPAGWPVSLAK